MTKTINISIPAELLELMDEAAKANFETRSNYIRKAILLRLGQESQDEGAQSG